MKKLYEKIFIFIIVISIASNVSAWDDAGTIEVSNVKQSEVDLFGTYIQAMEALEYEFCSDEEPNPDDLSFEEPWSLYTEYLAGYSISKTWLAAIAVEDGIVVWRGWHSLTNAYTVQIRHGDGWFSTYSGFYNYLTFIECGQVVKKGGMLGLAHFGAYYELSNGKARFMITERKKGS